MRRSFPRCVTCSHAKRTHARGWAACTACSCQSYVSFHANPPRETPSPEPARRASPAHTEDAPSITVQHRSFTAFAQYAQGFGDGPAVGSALDSTNAAMPGRDESWYGSLAPLALVVPFLLTGWPEGVAVMRETLDKIAAPRVQSVRRRGHWADQGDSVNLERMYAGDMEHAWRSTRRESSANAPRIRLLCNVGARAEVSKGHMFYRGAAVSALTEALVAAGYMVEVWAVSRAAGIIPSKLVTHAVLIKGYDAPLNLSVICATTAHIAVHRRLMFPARYRVAVGEGLPRGEPGYSVALESAQACGLPTLPGERTFIVDYDVLSSSDANAWLREAVASLEGRAVAC